MGVGGYVGTAWLLLAQDFVYHVKQVNVLSFRFNRGYKSVVFALILRHPHALLLGFDRIRRTAPEVKKVMSIRDLVLKLLPKPSHVYNAVIP